MREETANAIDKFASSVAKVLVEALPEKPLTVRVMLESLDELRDALANENLTE